MSKPTVGTKKMQAIVAILIAKVIVILIVLMLIKLNSPSKTVYLLPITRIASTLASATATPLPDLSQYQLAEHTVRARADKFVKQTNGTYLLSVNDDKNLYCTANPAIQKLILTLLSSQNRENLFLDINFRVIQKSDIESRNFNDGGCPTGGEGFRGYVFLITRVTYGYSYPPSTQAAVTPVPTWTPPYTGFQIYPV